jgi:hypothetical protein
MSERPILERLKLAESGKTYIASPDMNFYVLMRDAINHIEYLQAEIKSLDSLVACLSG